MQVEEFRAFCTSQIERLGGAFPEFRFYREGSIEELTNWLEAKADGDCNRAMTLVTEACGFEELPSIATLNAVWERLFPKPVRYASCDCEHCGGSGWEIVRRGNAEGANRCRCGGMPRGAQAA
jgi:hypothetical protein